MNRTITRIMERGPNSMLFEICQVEYGGKMVRGRKILCGRCGCVNRIPMSSGMHGGGNDDEQIERLAKRKFEKNGWVVGRRVADHRCPECIRLVTKPMFKSLEPLKEKEDTVPTPTLVTAPVMAETPAAMSRDDRRVIFAKLNEVYQDERKGYALDWSDKRVAEDLGVPRAWVVEVRDQNFGPDRNAEFIEAITEGKRIIADFLKLSVEIKAVQARHTAETEALTNRLTPIALAVTRIEKQIAAIEKAMVP